MDTLKILLGATVALLVGALAVSLKQMNQGVEGASEEDLTKMRQELREIEMEMERLKLERERLSLEEVASEPATAFVTEAQADQKVRELEAKMAMIAAENEQAKADAARAEEEANFLTGRYAEDRDKAARRIRIINEALLIATIAEWVEDPNFGDFATINIVSPENVQSGTVLAIRRNGGVLGKLRVSEVTLEGALANPLGAFGEVKPQVGDELILDEVVKLAD